MSYKQKSYIRQFGNKQNFMETNIVEDISNLVESTDNLCPTLNTGIFDHDPFAIGYPVLNKTCTEVIDTPAYPTFLATNLQGWKISGSVFVETSSSSDVIYLGSVENIGFFDNFPWKITGTVYTWDNSNYINVHSALASGAKMYDFNNSTLAPCDFQFIPEYYDGGFDLYLTYSTSDPSAALYGIVSFEYEFLENKGAELTMTFY